GQKFATGLPSGQKLVSFGPIACPKVAKLTAAFRGLIDVGSGKSAVRVLVDVVVFGAGRVELTLITTAPYSARAPVESAEARLAQLMIARAQPGAALAVSHLSQRCHRHVTVCRLALSTWKNSP